MERCHYSLYKAEETEAQSVDMDCSTDQSKHVRVWTQPQTSALFIGYAASI